MRDRYTEQKKYRKREKGGAKDIESEKKMEQKICSKREREIEMEMEINVTRFIAIISNQRRNLVSLHKSNEHKERAKDIAGNNAN